MDTTNDRLVELLSQHTELVRELHDSVLEINMLRIELLSGVKEVNRMLQRALSRPPGSPTSHYWKAFGEHWRSFELFSDKIQIAHQQLSVPFDLDGDLLEKPASKDADLWEDAIDDMDEALHSLSLRKEYRSKLLIVIELTDSAERLSNLQIPRASGKGATFTQALQNIRRIVKDAHIYLKDLLAKHGVSQIDLLIGQYPPPETTRIISRMDNNTDDNVLIIEIIANGYLWQDKLLRKADVIVTTQEGA